MPIAIHRWGVVVRKKIWVFSTETRSLPIERIYAYTPHLSPKFHLTPFAPTLYRCKISFKQNFCVDKIIYLYLLI